jgi:hypothetical protein
MVFDKVLEREIKKFDIDPEVKTNVKKYLSPDDKWDIAVKFFQSKVIDAKVGFDKNGKMIVFDFPSTRKAKEFADMPSEGLAAFARQWLRDKGEDFKIYDVYFNLGVMYDDKDEKKSKKVMIRVM